MIHWSNTKQNNVGYTVRSRYIAVIFHWITHESHFIARQHGQGMGCRSWVSLYLLGCVHKCVVYNRDILRVSSYWVGNKYVLYDDFHFYIFLLFCFSCKFIPLVPYEGKAARLSACLTFGILARLIFFLYYWNKIPSSIKTLTGPMLTQIYIVIWHY